MAHSKNRFATTTYYQLLSANRLLVLLGLALQQVLAVLVHLDLGDLDLGRADRDVVGLAVLLVAGDTLDVDAPLLAEDGGDLTFTLVVVAAHDLHLRELS